MNMTGKTLKEAMDDVEFVSCKNFSYQHSFLEDKLYFSVDLVCPEGLALKSVKVRTAEVNINHYDTTSVSSKAMCVICNQKLNPSDVQVSLCSSTLCSPHSSNAIRHLRRMKTEVQMSICSKEDHSCNTTVIAEYCGFR